ncbi:hypothetical protein ASPNIDRAFT_137356 [Aspergillus niger ATCC 1015]|uniref:Uncharacterized protein n=1 Tax=Aspergillus niger (strain ATCC 1015 / CBS 113.46 / FGSC A1144 / LSHB Ac4 / NCTC 3858a / NRRL 328 / USDA 3528.7) TaxID=380704 RepID=G3YCS2_ASPNA|nr:hypothetical protein ASPNIDRAFT_137356 [Aspergillus niger ATCC 1015]
MSSLGRTIAKFYENLDEAKPLFKRALDGLRKVLGPTQRGRNHPTQQIFYCRAQSRRQPHRVPYRENYKLQGRFNASIQNCDEAIEGLKQISVTQYSLERKLRAQKEETIAMREQEGQL